MTNNAVNNSGNTEVLIASDNEQAEHITTLFERVKSIYRCAERNGCTDANSEKEVLGIQEEFQAAGHKQGMLFCKKALSIIYEKRGDLATVNTEKVQHYEQAHDCINEAVIQAAQLKWEQPSLLKRQGIIKHKLGDALHQSGDHYNANILESDAFKIFGKMLHTHPDYAEGLFAYTAASFGKLKWQLRKLMFDLGRTENLFKNPKHTKHQPDEYELSAYRQQMEQMRSTINMLLAVTN